MPNAFEMSHFKQAGWVLSALAVLRDWKNGRNRIVWPLSGLLFLDYATNLLRARW